MISGTALYGDDSQYTVTQKYDSRLDMMVNYYYFWVKGKTDMPKNSVVKRKNTVAYVANLIQNPGAFDFKYYAISDTNKFLLFNVSGLVNSTIVLNMDIRTNTFEGDSHSVCFFVR